MDRRTLIVLPHLAMGGGERVASYLTECLYKHFDLHLVLYEKKITFPYQGKLHLLGTFLNKETPKLSLMKVYNFWSRHKSLRQLKKELQPNFSISFFQGANLLNLLTRSNKEKIICTVHTSLDKNKDFSGIYGLLHKSFVKFFYNKADAIVVPSCGLRDELIELFNVNPDKVKVIHNPVNISKLLMLSDEKIGEFEKIFSFSKVIINVGRLTEAKGQKFLIKVFRKLIKEFKNLKLIFLGDGELKDFLFSLSESMGLKTFAAWKKTPFHEHYDVYFLGFVSNPFPYIKRSEIFVLTSIWEGFANVIIEALALGVPVIATDCKHGPREILAPDKKQKFQISIFEVAEYGILVPVLKRETLDEYLTKEELNLLNSIRKLLQNRQLREYFRNKGYERAKDFDIEKFCRKWKQLVIETFE